MIPSRTRCCVQSTLPALRAVLLLAAALVPLEPYCQAEEGEGHVRAEAIRLEARNWENHGTDWRVGRSGEYEVDRFFLGRATPVRRGRLAPADVERLFRPADTPRLLDLPERYDAPFRSELGWWGYTLTVTTSRGTRSFRFHSEDASAPALLRDIVSTTQTLLR